MIVTLVCKDKSHLGGGFLACGEITNVMINAVQMTIAWR
ncbi:hypothetical protein L910_4859 [Vibrio fluvialis PG41]|uniref:Uncharacterized protein n=1 Tax=Vibrio fluvialis PG41 TaxID=1336752 RepID=S7I491_VIBFL|nr:hypothetical protein L910_4859 [Vibrio fluvialis PG41]